MTETDRELMRGRGIKKMKWISFPTAEKPEVLCNPYCGVYSIYRFFADHERLQPEEVLIEEIEVPQEHRLCLIEINLVHFKETELSETALSIVDRIFLHFTSLGRQMIVRFLYDWEGKGVLNEPKDIGIILGHMKQLSPLLKEYSEHIYILQGLFIGSWGEMHNSRYLGERQLELLAKELYECSGGNIQLALRCPSFWRMICNTDQPLTEELAFSDTRRARFSLFNDGIMASETDYGTYGRIRAGETRNYQEKWVREEELEFQNELCSFVSNGGEVINENPFNDLPHAIDTLRRMRISYLHEGYDEQVLNKWKSSRSGITNALWRDRSGYEYIIAHLGYRFRLEAASLLSVAGREGDLKASVRICNTGFAPCYQRLRVRFVLRTVSYSETYEYEVDTDTRRWRPQEKVELETHIPVTSLGDSKYILCFGLYDPRSQAPVLIANTFSVPDHTGMYHLGSLSIRLRNK